MWPLKNQIYIHMKKLFLLSITIFILIPGLFAQSVIKGKLLDSLENKPIEYASVAIYQLPDSSLVTGALTNSKGIFEIEVSKPGKYYLVAQFLGYENNVINEILIGENESVDLNTHLLSPNETLLNEVVVSGEMATTMHKVDRQVFQAGDFQSSRGGTATDVIKNMPSVNVNAQGEITVRGASDFVVFINGKPVQTNAALVLNQLPANAIENVELVTAPSARYDPEGKGGIINIVTKKGAADGIFIQVNAKVGFPSIEDYDNAEYAQRYGSDFILNYNKEKWNFSVGASYLRNDLAGRRVGDVYTIKKDTLTRFPSNGERSFDEINYSGRFTIGYAPNPNNDYSLGFFAGKHTKDRTADIVYYDNHALYQPSGERIYTMQYYNENLRIRRGDFILGSFNYSHTFKDKASISSSLLYEYTMLGGPTTNRNLGWPNTNIVYQDEYNTNDNPLNGVRFQADYKSRSYSFGTIEGGYQFRKLNHVGDFVYERKNPESGLFELVPEFSSRVDLKRQIHAGYGQLSGSKGKLDYTAGFRVEFMERQLDLQDKAGMVDTTYLYDFVKLYPSANFLYSVNNSLRIKGAYSKRINRITTFKMNPFPEREHSETLEQGDPRLLPEFIDLAELGIIKDFGNNSAFITTYFRNVNNLVNRVNTVSNDTILNRIYSNVGTGRSYGLELGTELNPFQWWKIYAGGNFYKYTIDGQFAGNPISTSAWVHSINANTTFALSPTFSIQWSLNYISDRVTAQGVDSKYLSPNLSLKKTFLNDKLAATLQWLNMDTGLLETNEQRITTWRDNDFYTTTNYIYEVDVFMLNLSYTINRSVNKSKFIKSEFGEKEF